VQCDRRVTLPRISEHLGISVEHVHHIVIEVLGYRNVCAVWVPKSLNDEQKATRMGICWEYVLRCERDGDKFLDRFVGGASPGVCTMIQGRNARVSSGNICNLSDRKRVVPSPTLVR
jgi:hypothetical protein